MPTMINNLLGQYTVVMVYLLTISKRNIIRILSLSQRMMCIFKNGWRLSLLYKCTKGRGKTNMGLHKK